MIQSSRLVVILIAIVATPVIAHAQAPAPDGDLAPASFGLGWNDTWLTPEDFTSSQGIASSDVQWSLRHYTKGWWMSIGYEGVDHYYRAHLTLPAGSEIDGYRVILRDDSDSERLFVAPVRLDFDVSAPSIGTETFYEQYDPPVAETPGYTSVWVDFDPNITYLNRPGSNDIASFYIFHVTFEGAVELRGIRVSWRRQISPAPAVATFADVPVGAFGFQHIEALAASGITAGCGGGNFCPDRAITRVEMAVFLAKALGLHWAP